METLERKSLMPQPQSDNAKRRQSYWRVRTDVPVGRGDLPGHASGKKTISSACRSCGIHEWSFPIGSADRLVTFIPSPKVVYILTSTPIRENVPAKSGFRQVWVRQVEVVETPFQGTTGRNLSAMPTTHPS